eukprot:augustus_masked-scaffold_3-processed-gene-21.100-mRNA-1 protein AED:1.00 eAED:1.00 QI:0/0/0/0/1/1/2/0/1160
MFVWQRTGNKADGCCTLVRSNYYFSNYSTSALSYNDYGNRICSIVTFEVEQSQKVHLLNTHFTYEHQNSHDPVQRVHQGRKLVEIVRDVVEKEFNEGDFIVISGDLNGNSENKAVKQCIEGLETISEEFCLCLNISSEHLPTDFVTHFDHNKNLMGCDFTIVLAKEKSTIEEVQLKVDVGDGLVSWELTLLEPFARHPKISFIRMGDNPFHENNVTKFASLLRQNKRITNLVVGNKTFLNVDNLKLIKSLCELNLKEKREIENKNRLNLLKLLESCGLDEEIKVPWNRMRLFFVGVGRTGKSSTLRSFVNEEFDEELESTIVLHKREVSVNKNGWKWSKKEKTTSLYENLYSLSQDQESIEKFLNKDRDEDFNLKTLEKNIKPAELEQFKSEIQAIQNRIAEIDVIFAKRKAKEIRLKPIEGSKLRKELKNLKDKLEMYKNVNFFNYEEFKKTGTAEQASYLRNLGLSSEKLLQMMDPRNEENQEKAKMKINIFDLGGQNVFHSIHHLFLTETGIYLLVFNLSTIKEGDNLSSLLYWYSTIRAHSKNTKIFIISTFFEDFMNENSPSKLKEVDNLITEKLKLDADENIVLNTGIKEYGLDGFNEGSLAFFPIDNKTRFGVNRVRSLIEILCMSNTWTKFKVDLRWMKILDDLKSNHTGTPIGFSAKLLNNKGQVRTRAGKSREALKRRKEQLQTGWVDFKHLRKKAFQCGIIENEDFLDMLEIFHSFGEIFRVEGTNKTDSIITVDTTWLVTAIGMLLRDREHHMFDMERIKKAKLNKEVEKMFNTGIISKDLFVILWNVRVPKLESNAKPKTVDMSQIVSNFPATEEQTPTAINPTGLMDRIVGNYPVAEENNQRDGNAPGFMQRIIRNFPTLGNPRRPHVPDENNQGGHEQPNDAHLIPGADAQPDEEQLRRIRQREQAAAEEQAAIEERMGVGRSNNQPRVEENQSSKPKEEDRNVRTDFLIHLLKKVLLICSYSWEGNDGTAFFVPSLLTFSGKGVSTVLDSKLANLKFRINFSDFLPNGIYERICCALIEHSSALNMDPGSSVPKPLIEDGSMQVFLKNHDLLLRTDGNFIFFGSTEDSVPATSRRVKNFIHKVMQFLKEALGFHGTFRFQIEKFDEQSQWTADVQPTEGNAVENRLAIEDLVQGSGLDVAAFFE